jgi:hypothetical protein
MIFRFLGRWVDEADQLVLLVRFAGVRNCFIETSICMFEGRAGSV